MVRRCLPHEFEQICAIINDGARAYQGVIPADCWSEPYMPAEDLQQEIHAGVAFWACEENGALCGVMGLQSVRDVTLVRHAYVLTSHQRKGIGAKLLSHLRSLAKTPVLIGTWADAVWAIRFYEKHGFRLIGGKQKDKLASLYWTVPERQMQASVILGDAAWHGLNRET